MNRLLLYRLLPFLFATTYSCFFILWSHDHHLHSDWRESALRERQTLGTPPRSFRGGFASQNNVSQAAAASARRMSYSIDLTRRLSDIPNATTTTTTEKCSPAMDPVLCHYLQTRPTCSCDHDIGAYYCCQRSILVVHKMGVTVVQSLVKDHMVRGAIRRSVPTPEITNHQKFGSSFRFLYDQPKVDDYRHVVVTRNWYDAILSGYLYHKSGKECWLDWYGRPNHKGWLLNNNQEDWERRLLGHDLTYRLNLTWTPGNGRDLCRYLSEEPEDAGLQVYTAWAMATYLIPLLEFRSSRQEREHQQGWNRTQFVCYEQLTDPQLQSHVFHSMGRWLFPDQTIVLNTTTIRTTADNKKHQGGHATDQDPKLRNRMRDLVKKMDAEVFGRAIEQGNAQFGCSSARPLKAS